MDAAGNVRGLEECRRENAELHFMCLFDQCIGATTLDEHRKHIEKDKALARRFQPVMVLEPSQVNL